MSDKGDAQTPLEKHDGFAQHFDGAHDVDAPVKNAMGTSYVNDAARGTEIEHELTFWQAAKKYPAAIGWTVVVCCAW